MCGLEISTDQTNILLAMGHRITANFEHWFIYPCDGQMFSFNAGNLAYLSSEVNETIR
jgi:hypothetical protein